MVISIKWSDGNARMRTNLKPRGGYFVVEELIPEIKHSPDSSRHTASGDSSLGSGADRKNDTGAKPNTVAFNPFVGVDVSKLTTLST